MLAKQNEFQKVQKNVKNKKIKMVASVEEAPLVAEPQEQLCILEEKLENIKSEPEKISLVTVDLIEYIKTKPYRYSFKNSLFKGYKTEYGRSVDNIDFNRIYMESCAVINSRFYACNMYAANFSFTVLKNCEIDTVNLATSRFTECTLENLNFKNSNIQKNIFDGSVLRNIVFRRCNLTNIDFSRVKLMENVEFKNCHVEFMILPFAHKNVFFSSSLSKENEEIAKNLVKDWTFEQHCRARKVILTDKDGRLIQD